MASRAASVRDGVVAAIQAAWSPSAPDGVSGVWAKDIVLDVDKGGDRLLTGRQVFVIVASQTQPRVADRKGSLRRYVVGVLVAERYEGGAGAVPTEWIDERVEWAEANVLDLLANPNITLSDGAVRLAFDEEQGIDAILDREILQKHRTFWSVATFVFQQVVDHA